MDYVNTWGVYQSFKGTDDEMVNSECRDDFFSLQPNGKIFQCIASEAGIIVLKYGSKTYSVDEKLYKIVCEPCFKVGDKVEVIEKGIIGQIVDVNWHFKDEAPFYIVKVNQKKLGKHFVDRDLRLSKE